MQKLGLKVDNVRPAPWKSTYILKPDLTLLTDSIAERGMMYPIVVQENGMYIIDGFARWLAAQKLGLYTLDSIIMDYDETDSMILHVELNRARGSLVAKDLSNLVKRCLRSGKYEPEDLRKKLHMTQDEFQVLADGSLVRRKKVKEHTFSKAWVPVETSGLGTAGPEIERPRTPDR